MPPQVCQRVTDHDGGFRVLMEPTEDIRRREAYLDLVRFRQFDGETLIGLIQGEPEDAQLVAHGEFVIRESNGARRASQD